MKYANKMMLVPYAQPQSVDNQMNQIVNSKLQPDNMVKAYNDVLANYISKHLKKNQELGLIQDQLSGESQTSSQPRQPDHLLQTTLKRLLKNLEKSQKIQKNANNLLLSNNKFRKVSKKLMQTVQPTPKMFVSYTNPAVQNVEKNISDSESETETEQNNQVFQNTEPESVKKSIPKFDFGVSNEKQRRYLTNLKSQVDANILALRNTTKAATLSSKEKQAQRLQEAVKRQKKKASKNKDKGRKLDDTMAVDIQEGNGWFYNRNYF